MADEELFKGDAPAENSGTTDETPKVASESAAVGADISSATTEEEEVITKDKLQQQPATSAEGAPSGNGENDEAPWGATFTVGSTVYAASIFWQPLQDPDNPLPEVRETAQNVLDNADLYVVRPSGMPQYGLGISAEGHKAGMPVAALALVDAMADIPSFVSVFKVPEGWWFLAIRNDLILSEEDMLFQKEEDARKNFISMMAVPDWGKKIAPDDWQIEGTVEEKIEDVFANTPKVKLAKLKSEINTKTIVYLAAILVALIWGGFSVISSFFGGEEVIREVIAPPPITRPVVDKPKLPPAPMPWENLVSVDELVSACSEAINSLTSSRIPGWVLGAMQCQPSGLSTSWTMEWGRISIFEMALKFYNIKNLHYVVANDGRSATATISFNNIKKASSAPTMKDKDLVAELIDVFQAINVPVALSITNVQSQEPAVPKAQRNVPGRPVTAAQARQRAQQQQQAQPAAALFSFVTFAFASDLPPSKWEIVFNAFSSLEITAITYNPSDNTWKYEGRIYGKK